MQLFLSQAGGRNGLPGLENALVWASSNLTLEAILLHRKLKPAIFLELYLTPLHHTELLIQHVTLSKSLSLSLSLSFHRSK